MALRPSRSALRLGQQPWRQCQKQDSTRFLDSRPISVAFSTTATVAQPAGTDPTARHAYTPPRMKAPFTANVPKDPINTVWAVNEDLNKLDDALNNFLGKGGDRLLPDELKWLAVTHKSFDQGRRGFNDRLAFLGRQTAVVEAVHWIMTNPDIKYKSDQEDPWAEEREPSRDPALENVDNLSMLQPETLLYPRNLHRLAIEAGLDTVVRWKPRKTQDLRGSGVGPVMSGAVYALVGAISLHNGGKVANRIVRERILKRLKVFT